MIVNVTGPNGGQPYSKQVANKISGGATIMATRLGIGHLPVTYTIKIGRALDKSPTDYKDARGICSLTKKNNKYFAEIFIMREDKISAMIHTLAHEMVHIKQFIKDGLCLSKSTFRDSVWHPAEGQCPYRNSPWEEEAYTKEPFLANHYLRYCTMYMVK